MSRTAPSIPSGDESVSARTSPLTRSGTVKVCTAVTLPWRVENCAARTVKRQRALSAVPGSSGVHAPPVSSDTTGAAAGSLRVPRQQTLSACQRAKLCPASVTARQYVPLESSVQRGASASTPVPSTV